MMKKLDTSLLNSLISGRITRISRTCDLISIQMESTDGLEVYIHIQSFLRILKKDQLIISSEDMYRCQKKKDLDHFEWDVPGKSIFDWKIKRYLPLLSSSAVTHIQKKPVGDLLITFENNLELQIIVDTSVAEEKYRIFNEAHTLIVSS